MYHQTKMLPEINARRRGYLLGKEEWTHSRKCEKILRVEQLEYIRNLPDIQTTCQEELFAEIVNGFQLLTIFTKNWSHLLKKSLMENFNFCAVTYIRKSDRWRAFITSFEALENNFKKFEIIFSFMLLLGTNVTHIILILHFISVISNVH